MQYYLAKVRFWQILNVCTYYSVFCTITRMDKAVFAAVNTGNTLLFKSGYLNENTFKQKTPCNLLQGVFC